MPYRASTHSRLYEMVQKRGNLTMRFAEKFQLIEIRELLGIPKGKLPLWGNLLSASA